MRIPKDIKSPRYTFVGIQCNREGVECAYMFTDEVYGSTVSIPVNDPLNVYERIQKLRMTFEKVNS